MPHTPVYPPALKTKKLSSGGPQAIAVPPVHRAPSLKVSPSPSAPVPSVNSSSSPSTSGLQSIRFKPSTETKLWDSSKTSIVNFPPKKSQIKKKPSVSRPKVVSSKRKSSFPESRRKKFKTELAGKRKSRERSSRFPEILPKKVKTVRARVSVLNPTQINKQWDSSSEDGD